jgi:myosin-6
LSLQECQNPFIQALFAGSASNGSRGKLTFISVGSKFKSQLEALMEKLRSTGTSFIRCIKPNVRMVAHLFEGGNVLSQLQCAGMTSVLELMQQGYPSRALFAELYNLYRAFLPPELARLDPRLFCKALFKALGLNEADFKFGMTKVFFRPGKFAEFDQLMRSDPENLRILVSRVKRWLVRSQWRKAQWCAWSVVKLARKIEYRREALVTIQKTVRMFLAKKRHRPRIRALVNIRGLSGQVAQIAAMANGLKAKDKESVLATVQSLNANIAQAVAQIKGGGGRPGLTNKKELDRLYQGLVDKIRAELAGVKQKIEKQKAAEEAAKLRQLQEEMERQRRAREAEAAEAHRLEEERRLRAEMEQRRRQEEERQRQLEERERVTAESMQRELDTANARLAEQLEQERRDHELALRLAVESGGSVEELQLKRSSMVTAQREAAAAKKYDLAKWKYAELRDTINTSCDIELLEACRYLCRLRLAYPVFGPQIKSLNFLYLSQCIFVISHCLFS